MLKQSYRLTGPGQASRPIGFSTTRRYNVTEPLPAPGVAGIWNFEVQYRYPRPEVCCCSLP